MCLRGTVSGIGGGHHGVCAVLSGFSLSVCSVSRVTTMRAMFQRTRQFNSDVSGWNVSRVTDYKNMFYLASGFWQDLCSWGPQILAANSTSDEGVNVELMFRISDCPVDIDPDLMATPPGPFCVFCN